MSTSSKSLYEIYKMVPEDWVSAGDPNVFSKKLKEAAKNGKPELNALLENGELSNAAYMAIRVANQCSEDEFCDMVSSGETPPIQLTQREMAVLKGGGFPWAALAGGLAGLGGILMLSQRRQSGGAPAGPAGFDMSDTKVAVGTPEPAGPPGFDMTGVKMGTEKPTAGSSNRG